MRAQPDTSPENPATLPYNAAPSLETNARTPPMETPRWELISHLYDAALERPPAERGAFLKDACAGDAALKQELESLLRHEPAAARFLDIPASQIAANALKPDLVGVGRQLGPYKIAALLGAGGMGEVYRARDSKLARDVAIKTLPPELASDPNRLTRFHREARALATLNHPNIAAIYGLEEWAGGSYLVLELVDGETLADRLSQTGPMATGEVLRIASQIAEALEAAHGKGITHRDIKPSNVKVTPEGRVKVLDFGLAKSLPQGGVYHETSTLSTATALHTESGAIVGTPPYMSPEQIRGHVTDQRTDVWAFGCVVYELLSGKRPFRGSTVPDIFAAILQGEPDWHDLPAGVPGDVRTLLRGCLEKDASRRWQSFDVVRRELARARSARHGARTHAPPARSALWRCSCRFGGLAGFWRGRAVWQAPTRRLRHDPSLVHDAAVRSARSDRGHRRSQPCDNRAMAVAARRDRPPHRTAARPWRRHDRGRPPLSRAAIGMRDSFRPVTGRTRAARERPTSSSPIASAPAKSCSAML